MKFGDNRLKRITRFLWKYLWCSWKHRKDKCYPEVWNRGLDGPWHCMRCHDCGEAFDFICDEKEMGWL